MMTQHSERTITADTFLIPYLHDYVPCQSEYIVLIAHLDPSKREESKNGIQTFNSIKLRGTNPEPIQ